MMNALPTQPAQWFERKGIPVFEPATVPQARQRGLLPSVHNLLGVIARPAVDQSSEASVRTAQLCADIQWGAERVARGLDVDPEDPVKQWLWCFREWAEERCRKVRWIGQTAVHKALGYACTPWMLIEHRGYGLTLVDLKVQGPRRGTSPATYKSWGYEMAAWRMALQAQGVTDPFGCLTLVMNSLEPHVPVEALWGEDHLTQCRRGFLAARQLWVVEHGYNPTATRPRKEAA